MDVRPFGSPTTVFVVRCTFTGIKIENRISIHRNDLKEPFNASSWQQFPGTLTADGFYVMADLCELPIIMQSVDLTVPTKRKRKECIKTRSIATFEPLTFVYFHREKVITNFKLRKYLYVKCTEIAKKKVLKRNYGSYLSNGVKVSGYRPLLLFN